MSGLKLTRTVDLSNLTPEEVANVFCSWFGEQQAEFFGHIAVIAKAWPGAGLCQQSYYIAENLDDDGRFVIDTIKGHIDLRAEGPSQ